MTFKVLLGLLACLISQHAVAVLRGRPAWDPKSTDDQLVREATVRLVYEKNGEFLPYCSGVILGPGEVLSAGHCLSDDINSLKEKGKLFVEASDAHGKVTRLQVDSFESSENFHRDISLVKVRGSFPMNSSLPLAYSGCDEGSPLISAGFGLDESNRMSKVVKIAYSREATAQERSLLIELHDGIITENGGLAQTDYWLVMHSQSGKVCPGDSGGPVFCKSKGRLALAGITTAYLYWGKLLHGVPFADAINCQKQEFSVAGSVPKSMEAIEALRGLTSSSFPASTLSVVEH